ncbi:hypothetical protein TNIN_126831 [Trichonephila inaurata madagascariensis]|uniref:Uncharacterized protein n=1 Tax=Trichonephila inaurata madagascariensis TaxID=2747483 RepID=A0A8X6YI82_9ARAC|nr:hypothetical protein TNIN_126831 [Trichonephila inaurata madagascariensis]
MEPSARANRGWNKDFWIVNRDVFSVLFFGRSFFCCYSCFHESGLTLITDLVAQLLQLGLGTDTDLIGDNNSEALEMRCLKYRLRALGDNEC